MLESVTKYGLHPQVRVLLVSPTLPSQSTQQLIDLFGYFTSLGFIFCGWSKTSVFQNILPLLLGLFN